ncbi:unnamed protein product [Mucor hiemalis]
MDGHGPIPLQFQLLFNWEIEATQEALYKNKTRIFPAFKVELNNTPIYRLIHHEFERHFVSAGQLFKSCGLTLTEGFFLFELKLTDFEVDFLISQFPYCDIWVSVEQARAMALALGVESELGLLLGEELDECYTTDNMNRNEIMHNWIVPSIPNLQYSTRALLETTFDTVELLQPPNRKIRTQIAARSDDNQNGMVMKDRTENGLVRWQVWAYEQFLHNQNSVQQEEQTILDRSGAVWDSLQGILYDLQTLSRKGQAKVHPRVLSDNMMVGNMPLKKEYLGHSLLLQQLYIAVMSEKIMNEMNRVSLMKESEKEVAMESTQTEEVIRNNKKDDLISPSTSSLLGGNTATTNTTATSATTNNNRADNNMLFHDRMDLLEQDLYRVKRRAKKKFDEIQLYQDDLVQQISDLNSWKMNSERARKSERVWMLMMALCVIFGVLSLRTLY